MIPDRPTFLTRFNVPAISLSVAGYSAYLGLPVILGGLSSVLGWDSRQLGWIGGLELCGLLLGAVFTSAIVTSGRTFLSLIIAVGSAMATDLASAFVSGFWLMCALRLVAGFAGGVCYAGSNSYLSQSQNPARSFSHQAFAFVGFISLEIVGLQYVIDQCGLRGLFITLAAIYGIPAVLLPYLAEFRAHDRTSQDSTVLTQPSKRARRLGWRYMGLGAVALYNMGAGCFWAFAQTMGVSSGQTGEFIANVLNISNLCSLATCLAAWRVAARWGQRWPLTIALAVICLTMVSWPFDLGAAGFSIWMFVYFQATALTAIYQVGVLSALDPSGRMSALYPAALGAGLGIGPILGGTLLSSTFTFRHLMWCEAGVTAIAAALFATVNVVSKPDLTVREG